jgi:hypothetical protein
MLGSTVLEVAIGLVFCFASIALIASSVYEAIASLWKLRASSLLDGVKSMLNDPHFTGLARAPYNNALVKPRGPGTATTQRDLASKPSYIEPNGSSRRSRRSRAPAPIWGKPSTPFQTSS